jgi:hypothetical protein
MTDQIEAVDTPGIVKPTKTAIVRKLLSRPRGASLGEITAVTGWQAHSIRSFLTGLRKKGLALEREQRRDGSTSYRLLKSEVVAAAGGPRDA